MHTSRTVVLPLLLILILLPAPDAAAQRERNAATADDMRAAAQAMDCAAMAAIPNAPMTRDACEALKASGMQLGQAMGQEAGGQPGDDAMTCDQIAAELQAMQVAGVSAEHAEEAQAAGEQLRQSQRQAQAAAATMAARQTVETAAAAGAPNAVGGAVAMRQSVEAQALARRSSAQRTAAQSRAGFAIAAANQDLAAAMQANPRFGHLIRIAGTRCSHHPVFDGSATP